MGVRNRPRRRRRDLLCQQTYRDMPPADQGQEGLNASRESCLVVRTRTVRFSKAEPASPADITRSDETGSVAKHTHRCTSPRARVHRRLETTYTRVGIGFRGNL